MALWSNQHSPGNTPTSAGKDIAKEPKSAGMEETPQLARGMGTVIIMLDRVLGNTLT